MKKIIMLVMLALLVGCSTEETYNKDTKTVVCTSTVKSIVQVDGETVEESTTSTMEITYWVEEGLLVKVEQKMITPLSEIENVEEKLASDTYVAENSVHEIEGTSMGKPYIDGDNYVWVISIEDYTNVKPYVEYGLPEKVLNKKGDAIIFDLYQKHLDSLRDEDQEKPVCTIVK